MKLLNDQIDEYGYFEYDREDVLPEMIVPDGIKLPVPKKQPKVERATLKKKIAEKEAAEDEAAEQRALSRNHYS